MSQLLYILSLRSTKPTHFKVMHPKVSFTMSSARMSQRPQQAVHAYSTAKGITLSYQIQKMGCTISCSTILFMIFIMCLIFFVPSAPFLVANLGVGLGLLGITVEIVLLVTFGKLYILKLTFKNEIIELNLQEYLSF